MSSAQMKLAGTSAKPIVGRKEELLFGMMLIVCKNLEKKARQQKYVTRSSSGVDLA